MGGGVHALVTGGSTGIGAATVRILSRDGYAVAVHCHQHRADAEALVDELRPVAPNSFVIASDLSTTEGPDHLAREVLSRWSSLDALVLNAGTYPRQALDDVHDEEWDTAFRLHVRSSALLVERLLPAMRKAPAPSVVFVTSVLAFTGTGHGAPYATAKAALLGLGRSLARELAPDIRVNLVAPGAIDTAILAGDTSQARAERLRAIPLGRLGRSDEVGEAIAFLLSARASYISGATLHVNGAWYTG